MLENKFYPGNLSQSCYNLKQFQDPVWNLHVDETTRCSVKFLPEGKCLLSCFCLSPREENCPLEWMDETKE